MVDPEKLAKAIDQNAVAHSTNDAILARGIQALDGAKAGKIWTVGAALGATISWSANESILWAFFHSVISWVYVIYYAFGFGHP